MYRESVYRVYMLDEKGKFLRADVLSDCASDEEAIDRARKMLDGHDLEVWERDRKLANLSAAKDKKSP